MRAHTLEQLLQMYPSAAGATDRADAVRRITARGWSWGIDNKRSMVADRLAIVIAADASTPPRAKSAKARHIRACLEAHSAEIGQGRLFSYRKRVPGGTAPKDP